MTEQEVRSLTVAGCALIGTVVWKVALLGAGTATVSMTGIWKTEA